MDPQGPACSTEQWAPVPGSRPCSALPPQLPPHLQGAPPGEAPRQGAPQSGAARPAPLQAAPQPPLRGPVCSAGAR
eukprot:4438500-Alexandrium_andersonii.AAC.1